MPRKFENPHIYNWNDHILQQYDVPRATREVAYKNFKASWSEAIEYYNKKNYAPALNRFHQALNAIDTIDTENKTSEDHFLNHICLVRLGECLLAKQDYASAHIYFQTALNEVEHIKEAQTSKLNNFEFSFIKQAAIGYIFSRLAAIANQIGKFQDANLYYQLAVNADQVLLKLQSYDHHLASTQMGQHLIDLTLNDFVLHRYDAASQHALASVNSLSHVPVNSQGRNVKELLAKAYYHAGEAFLLKGQYSDAIVNFKEAEKRYASLVKSKGEKSHLDMVAKVNEMLAYAYAKDGDYVEAGKTYKQAEDRIKHLKSAVEGKRYRFDGRSRLNESKAAVRKVKVRKPVKHEVVESAAAPVLVEPVLVMQEQSPKQPPKKSFFHFMHFFKRRADTLPDVPRHEYHLRQR